MNWFLLLLILKLFTTNWSAPIDLVENREEFQQDLDNLINKGFSVADEANNLIQTSEALVNGTVNAFNSSAVNESLNENLHKVEEDLHKFSSELQKELQKDSTQDVIEVSFEQKPIEEEVSAQVTEISSFDGAAKKEGVPIEISTEHVGEILANTESRSNTVNLSETSEAAQDLNGVKVESSDNLANQSQYSIGNTQEESSSTEQQSFQYPSSTSINDAHEVPETNEEEVREVASTITSTEHQNEQLPHSSTEDIPQQVSTEGTPNFEHAENSKDSSDLKETVDTLANDLLHIASMVQTSTESSDVADAHENVNVSETFTEEHSERTPSFRKAVDSFIEDIVKFGSKLGLAPEQTSEQPSAANQDPQNEREIQTSSVNPVESSTEQHEQSTEYPLPNTDNNDSQQITPEVQTISNPVESSSVTTASGETNGEALSTETPALKETVVSFINQVANIGSSLGETAKEIIDNAAMIKPEADNSSNSVLSNATSNNLEHSESQNPEETHEKVPTFKDAVDAFIEDVVEIGSKLGLVPEEKPAEGAVPETTEQENKTAESTAASDLNVSNSNVEETTDKAEEITPTTLSPMDSLNENQQENIPKADENTEYSNFGRSADTLIQAASEIGNNFSEAVSNLFSLSDNPQETVAEIQNETATEIATPEEQNKTNDHQTDSEASSTVSPIENNVEISSTTESLPQTLENKQETENVHVPEAENFNDQIVKESPEEAKPKEEVKSAQFVEYIPVAVITIPEEELQSERSAIAPQNETDQLNAETKSVGEEHQVNNETKTAEDEVTANASNKTTLEERESQSTSESQQSEELTTIPSATEAETTSSESPKSEEQTTSSPIAPETTTQAHSAVIEETTNAFNKFENTLKTLIEQEKLKQQEKHLSTLETSQQETTTLAPNSQTFTTAKEESNTLVPQDETTMLPKKFEEELQMAVKALEETTHHHFEEFQNNLKEAFKKFTVWGAEHERPGEATTNKNNIEETTQNSTEQSTTLKTEEDSASTTEKVVETPLTEEEEPHRIGAINQNFVDRFSDNYQENAQMTATEEQKKEEESTFASEPEREQTTEITFTLTTTMSPVEDEEDGKGTQEEQQVGVTDSVEHSTIQNIVEENPTPTAESIVKGGNEEAADTTESIPETTIMPLLARVPMHIDITSISLTTAEESATETLTHDEAATQPLETEQLKETHTELTQTQTAQPTEREQETITLSSPASYPQEMVTFIEQHEDTTTARQADDKEEETTKEIEEENTAKSQTQEPLTQAAFMEEQQQQIESTTEHEAQTQTAAASGQTTATTANIEDDAMTTQEQQAEQQTTETEIYSTTVVEKEEDETTVAAITSTAAAAAVEPEPRSLSLPPPKLEYLQNEDGVEIFYGYSIVKHN